MKWKHLMTTNLLFAIKYGNRRSQFKNVKKLFGTRFSKTLILSVKKWTQQWQLSFDWFVSQIQGVGLNHIRVLQKMFLKKNFFNSSDKFYIIYWIDIADLSKASEFLQKRFLLVCLYHLLMRNDVVSVLVCLKTKESEFQFQVCWREWCARTAPFGCCLWWWWSNRRREPGCLETLRWCRARS